jgi:hypothetical protein
MGRGERKRCFKIRATEERNVTIILVAVDTCGPAFPVSLPLAFSDNYHSYE